MGIEITGRKIVVPDREKERARELIQKLERVTGRIDEARLVLSGERHSVVAEVSVTCGRDVYKAHERSEDVAGAVRAIVEKVSAQAKKQRARRNEHKGKPSARKVTAEWEVAVVTRESLTAPRRPRIVKTTRIPIRPMSADEAAVELDASEHGFIVYRDASSERISVLYRRRDGNYGLISPEW